MTYVAHRPERLSQGGYKLWVFRSYECTIEAVVHHVPCFCQAYLLSQVVTSVFRVMGRELVKDKLGTGCAWLRWNYGKRWAR